MTGVATRWLKQKDPNKSSDITVPIFVRKSQFRLPFKPSVPIIMIGPGTGLAPFRGFLQDRHSVKAEGNYSLMFQMYSSEIVIDHFVFFK